MGRSKQNENNAPPEAGQTDLQTEELIRNYQVSTDLIEKSTDFAAFFDLILQEYGDRLDELPGLDLASPDAALGATDQSEKLRSLVMFASQATLLKEKAEIFRKLDASNKEHRKLSDKLEKQNSALRALNEQYLGMLGFVSHELRSPLISILGFAELLDEDMLGKLNPEQHKAVSVIIRSCRTLNELIQNYLDLAKIEEGRMVLDKTTLDLYKDVLLLVLEEMTERFNKKNLSIWVEADSEPLMVDCDPVLIRVVFNNLLSNAAKYANDDGNITIRISNSGDNYEVAVVNTGPGMNKSQLKKLFGKFTQIDPNQTQGTQGSGLGLYNAKHIVEKHDGTMWAESEPDSYFSIVFTLPMALAHSPFMTDQSMAG